MPDLSIMISFFRIFWTMRRRYKNGLISIVVWTVIGVRTPCMEHFWMFALTAATLLFTGHPITESARAWILPKNSE